MYVKKTKKPIKCNNENSFNIRDEIENIDKPYIKITCRSRPNNTIYIVIYLILELNTAHLTVRNDSHVYFATYLTKLKQKIIYNLFIHVQNIGLRINISHSVNKT